ncbi:Alpha/Beta hydrolase protein [Xylariaceae sp. FL1651]|nr:Alpha/Beta hydrolase protein [Xylariaceae sp. FL1651]
MESITKSFNPPGESTATMVVATTVVTTLALISFARYTLWPRKPQIIRGALTTSVPQLSEDEVAKVSYRLDHYPGARDVVTPYGNIRVYEFGPEDGRKVLLIHGISTSCMTLTDIANALVEKGCRVMMFDLFGRGFSDTPGDLPHDTRLFLTEILLVLASSPLSWTGNNALSIIGYSLGGGIAANFAATFPDMVESLVFLAPSGLIRPENIGRMSRLIFTSGLVPERLLAWLTKARLRTPIDNAVSKRRPTAKKLLSPVEDKADFVDVAVQEALDPPTQQDPTPFELEVTRFVHWSIDYNEGFVPAMMSSIRYAPLMEQQQYWRALAKRKPGSTAILLGRDDTLVQHEDYEEDALPMLGGRDNVFWRIVPGAHNFPFTHPQSALAAIFEFWHME